MSCRVIRDGEAATGPFPWKRVGQEVATPAAPVRFLSPGSPQPPATPPPREPSVDNDAEWQRRVDAARQEGYRQGEAEGTRAAAAKLEQLYAKLGKTLEELAGYRPKLRRQAEEDVVKLALAIARRVVQREVHIDHDVVLALVKTGLQRIEVRDIQRIRVAPEDAPVIEKYLAESRTGAHTEVFRDPSLSRGAVVFVTSRGELDASIETQLGEVEKVFGELMR